MNSNGNEYNSKDSSRPKDTEPDGSQESMNPADINVLIVEDTEINRIILTRLLKSKSFNVENCRNGLEALKALETKDFDIILMDVEMPEMDGLTATRRIREMEVKSGKHVPIIAITAKREPEECFKAGMDAYVPKLISGKELFSTIFKFHEKYRTSGRNEKFDMIENLKLEQLPIFDKDKVLDNLMGDTDLLNELVGMFSLELPDFSTKINKHFQEGNLAEVRKVSHQLKGAAGFSGARRIERIAQEIQHISEDDKACDIEPLLIQMEKEKNDFLNNIKS